MNCITDYRLEDFILGLSWEKLPCEVQDRLRGCFTDLLGAIVTGSRMTAELLPPEAQEEILRLVFTEDPPVREIISLINKSLSAS